MDNPAEKVVEWAKAHPMPAAAAGGVTLALVAGVALRAKGKKTTQGQYTIPNVLTPGAFVPANGPGGIIGSDPGSVTSTLPQWLQDLINGPSQQNAPAPKTTTTTAPTAAPNPFVTPQPNVFGSISSVERITNPLGSAYAASQGNPYYQPSLSDYASEIGSGITRTVAYAPGTPSNYVYTVDNTSLGSGSPVAVADRIPGERYDAYGRVIL